MPGQYTARGAKTSKNRENAGVGMSKTLDLSKVTEILEFLDFRTGFEKLSPRSFDWQRQIALIGTWRARKNANGFGGRAPPGRQGGGANFGKIAVL